MKMTGGGGDGGGDAGCSGGSGGAGDGGDDGSPPQTRAVYESLHTQEPYMNPAYEQEPYKRI